MNKVMHVPAYFEPVGENVTRKVSTGETKKGMFGGEKPVKVNKTEWVKTGYSNCRIDSRRLAKDTQTVIASLNKEGYGVVSITPITSGTYDYAYRTGAAGQGGFGYGYGYGYSYTDSIIIVAEKKSSS